MIAQKPLRIIPFATDEAVCIQELKKTQEILHSKII